MGKAKAAREVSVIGGADGPTSIFIAGKTGNIFINADDNEWKEKSNRVRTRCRK